MNRSAPVLHVEDGQVPGEIGVDATVEAAGRHWDVAAHQPQIACVFALHVRQSVAFAAHKAAEAV